MTVLPLELWCEVCDRLTLSELGTASRVNRRWNKLTWATRRRLNLTRHMRFLEDYLVRPVLAKCSGLIDLECPPGMTDADLEDVCTSAPQLVTLGVRRAIHVTDDGLRALSSLHHLSSLYLSASWNVTSAGMRMLLPVAHSLERLELRGCDRITSDALEVLSRFSKLRVLDLRDCRLVGEDALVHLHGLPLEELDLSGLDVSDRTVCQLAEKVPSLKKVVMWGCDMLSDEGVCVMAKYWKELKILNLALCTKLTDVALEAIATMVHLQCLAASSPSFSYHGIQRLTGLKQLQNVSVMYSPECRTGLRGKELFPWAERVSLQQFIN